MDGTEASAPATPDRANLTEINHSNSDLHRAAPVFRRGDCPPEMAKSDVPCPASRVKATSIGSFHIGDKIPFEDVHIVTRPGLYGIGAAPRGSLYGIIDGRLIRYNPETMRVQSVIRYVEAILD